MDWNDPLDVDNAPTELILERISALQNIQKRNPYSSKAWQEASAALQPLFKQMAARTA